MKRFGLLPIYVLLALIPGGGLCGQDQNEVRTVRGPVMGFLYDRNTGIRPVLGIPGAATLGAAVLSPSGIRAAGLAPGGDYAVAVLSEGGTVALVRNLSHAPQAAVLEAPSSPTRIAFSPDGSAAAFYYAPLGRVEVYQGLPDNPELAWSSELSALEGELEELALSAGGRMILAAGSGEPCPVWIIDPEQGQRLIRWTEAKAKLAFLNRREAAVIADGGTGKLWLAEDLKHQPSFSPLGGAMPEISRPAAVAVDPLDRRVFVAVQDPPGVVGLSLTGEETLRLACPCTPGTLDRLGESAAFRLSEEASAPVWLLDAGGAAPRIVFVPEAVRIQRDTGRGPAPRRTGGVR
ncbi:MAG: hypothetical protein K6T61_01045 [Bryobacteraceae bacterium]|nr:hypothetical protein [Bryobacteraceae bacterium]